MDIAHPVLPRKFYCDVFGIEILFVLPILNTKDDKVLTGNHTNGISEENFEISQRENDRKLRLTPENLSVTVPFTLSKFAVR